MEAELRLMSIPPPASEAQIEALVSRLGDAGIAAVAGALGGVGETGEIAAGN